MKLLVINQSDNDSLVEESFSGVNSWLKSVTDNKLNLEIDYLKSNVVFKTKKTFVDAGGIGVVERLIIDPVALSEFGKTIELKNSKDYDVVFLLYNDSLYSNPKPSSVLHTQMVYEGFTTVQIKFVPNYQQYTLVTNLAHELMHCFYTLINHRGHLDLPDDVHSYASFDDPRPQYGYKTLLEKLKPYWHYLITKESMIVTLKEKGKPEIYCKSSTSNEICWIGGWESYQNALKKGWIKEYVELDDLSEFTKINEVFGFLK